MFLFFFYIFLFVAFYFGAAAERRFYFSKAIAVVDFYIRRARSSLASSDFISV
jgi:hypothetical protein